MGLLLQIVCLCSWWMRTWVYCLLPYYIPLYVSYPSHRAVKSETASFGKQLSLLLSRVWKLTVTLTLSHFARISLQHSTSISIVIPHTFPVYPVFPQQRTVIRRNTQALRARLMSSIVISVVFGMLVYFYLTNLFDGCGWWSFSNTQRYSVLYK